MLMSCVLDSSPLFSSKHTELLTIYLHHITTSTIVALAVRIR